MPAVRPDRHAICFLISGMITQEKASTMSKPTSQHLTRCNDLPQDISDLLTAIESLPPEHRQTIEPALGRVVENTQRRRRILTTIQDAIGQLRLDMKYLMFDLEATRRERDALRGRQE